MHGAVSRIHSSSGVCLSLVRIRGKPRALNSDDMVVQQVLSGLKPSEISDRFV